MFSKIGDIDIFFPAEFFSIMSFEKVYSLIIKSFRIIIGNIKSQITSSEFHELED